MMQQLQCVLLTPGLEVYHDLARGWLYTRWLEEHTVESIAQAINVVCVHLRGNSYTKILSDHSGLASKWPEQSPWQLQPYFDVLAAHGILYFAWVYNESNYNRRVMEQTLQIIVQPAVAAFQDWLPPTSGWTVALRRSYPPLAKKDLDNVPYLVDLPT
jgi:hypothetical protein